MYSYLKGQVAYKAESPTGGHYFVVDVNGMGFQVHTNLGSFVRLSADDLVTVYTTLIVREDLMQLVGFLTREERDMFDMLGSASGVGVKVALALLSELSVSELAGAIMAGDHKRLTAAKGVGPKLAQKITLELKDKMAQWRDTKMMMDPVYAADTLAPLEKAQAFQEAETVLLSLGYSLQEVHLGLQAMQQQHTDVTQASSEEVLQFVLKWLATHPARS